VANSSPEQIAQIIREASSIRSHYAGLNLSAVEGESLPTISGPVRAPIAIHRFPIAKLAMSALLKRIHTPNHHEYPLLAVIPPKTYVCNVCQMWPNAALDIWLFKP
jgi:hypothetical protein